MNHQGNEVLWVAIANATGNDSVVLAAPGAGKRIVVLAYVLTLDAAGEFMFESSTGTALTGWIEVAADSVVGLSHSGGVLACAANQSLTISTTAAANGHLSYIIESTP